MILYPVRQRVGKNDYLSDKAFLSKCLNALQPVKSGHQIIHDDQVVSRWLREDSGQSLLSIRCAFDLIPLGFQETRDHDRDCLAVFSVENMSALIRNGAVLVRFVRHNMFQ